MLPAASRVRFPFLATQTFYFTSGIKIRRAYEVPRISTYLACRAPMDAYACLRLLRYVADNGLKLADCHKLAHGREKTLLIGVHRFDSMIGTQKPKKTQSGSYQDDSRSMYHMYLNV